MIKRRHFIFVAVILIITFIMSLCYNNIYADLDGGGGFKRRYTTITIR